MTGFSRGRPFRPLGLLIVLAFVVHLAVSAPSREKRAAAACTNEVGTGNSELKYEVGKTYNYDIESEIVTQIEGGSDGDSRLKFKVQAALAVVSSCEYLLTVVKIDSPTHSAAELSDIEKTSIQFNYQNGELDPESVILSQDDPVWSANIKRAIVSMFNNHALGESAVSSLVFRETDVTGSDCLTKYKITGASYVKTRDLNHCSKRDGGIWIAQGIPYPTTKPRILQSNPLLKSTQTCNQDFTSGKLQASNCYELHKLEIYNQGGVGAQTSVTTTLKLTGEAAGNAYGAAFKGTKPSCIRFDHSDDSDKSLEGTGKSGKFLVDELCKEVAGGILGPKTTSLYLNLRRQLARTALSDLQAIYADLTAGKGCSGAEENEKVKVLFQDAAANAGRTSAIEFVAKIYNTLDERAQGLFRLSASFAVGPEEPALEAVATLLGGGDSRLLLAASGLAHQYCLVTNKDCGKSAAYNSISDAIAVHAKANCAGTDQAKIEKSIAALQALGNLDSLSKNAVDAVTACLAAPKDRVVDHALQAFRRDPCQAGLKAKAREILADQSRSSDLRIHAYLAVANCLNEEDAAFISTVIAGKSSQVYWYIASHRHNQLHSDNQVKATSKSKHAFNLIKVPKASLKPDARKYSSNFDMSFFDKRENTGGSLGGNVIYAADSFVPRTVTGDLNIDWLGRSFQLFEVGVSLEDFDSAAERVFRRILREEEDAGADPGSSRRKREVAQPNFQQSDVDTLRSATKISTLRETNGITDVYVRIFGTTVCANSFLLDDLVKESEELKESLQERIRNGLVGGLNLDFTQGMPYFIDNINIPTVSGFPLNLELESSAAVSLKATGDLDKGKSLKSRFAPSGSVQTRGRMVVGAGPVEAGLQIEANLHSARDVSVELTTVPGKTKGFNYDAKINFPQDKVHLLDIRSDLYWVSRSGSKAPTETAIQVASKLPPIVLLDNECLDTVSQFLGLKYCATVKLAQLGGGDAPVFPLTGSVLASLTLEKSDPSVKDYLIQLHVDNEESADKHLSLVFDTPGSTTNRKIVLTATGVGEPGSKEKTLDLIIESPWKKLTGKGKYTKAPKDGGVTTRTATFEIKADGSKTLLDTTYSGDYADKSYLPLSSKFDFDLKYGMESQHSLTINTKYEHKTRADLSFEGKVTSSRIPRLNFDIKWDRTISWELVKLNLAYNNKGSGNAVSLNSVTKLDGKGITSNTDAKVSIPAKKLDITYKASGTGDKATMKASGDFELNAGPVQASSKFSLDGLNGAFEVESSASGQGKKLTFSTKGGKTATGREYALKLNVEPKVFDIDLKTTATISDQGDKVKLVVQTTATTSLLPNQISTTVEGVKNKAGSVPSKLSAQLNLGNDRLASVSYEFLAATGQKTSVIAKAFVQKRLDSTLEVGIDTAGEGASLSTKLDATYIPLGRRIKHDTNIKVSVGAGKKYDLHLDTDLKWDFDKDPKQGFYLSSDVVGSLTSFSTKNAVTVKGTPYKFSLDIAAGQALLNEEHSWKLAYQSGTNPEHTIGFQFKAENADKAKKVNIGVQMDLDSVPNTPKEVKIQFGVTDLDSKSFYFDSLSRVEVFPRGAGSKILEVEISTKPAAKGRSIRAEVRDDLVFMYGIDVSADIGADGVDVNYERSASGKKLTLIKLGASKGVSGKLSEIKLSSVYDRDFSGEPTFKATGNFLYRFNSLWDFELTETYVVSDRTEGASAVRDADNTLKLKISSSDFLVKNTQSLKIPGWDENSDFELSGKREGNKLSGLINVRFTNNSETIQVVKSDISVTPGFPGDSELIFNLALPPVVKYQTIEVKIKHDEVSKGQSYNNNLQAKINDIQFEVESKVELGAKKSGDFSLKLNKDPVRKLNLAYDKNGPSIQASIQWGSEPLTISTSGKVIPVGEGFDVELDFDSALLPDKRWELKISRRVEATKKSLNINLDNPQSKQNLKFGVEKVVQDANRKYSLNYDANLSLASLRGLLQGQKGQVTLDIDKKAFDAAREKAGTQVKLDAQLGPITLAVTGKKSDLEGKLSVSVCPAPDKCTTADAQILQDTGSFKALADVVRKGIKVGFSAENKKSGGGCDTTAKIYYPLGSQQKEMGLRVFSGDGADSDLELTKKEVKAAASSVRKYGVEVTLGPRTLSAVAAKGSWDSDAADADAVEIRIWLDKSREPARSLAVSFTNVMASGGKQGRDVGVVASHPDFKKDHRLKTSYRFDSAGESLFDITTEIDIFKTTADTLVVKTYLKQALAGDSPVFQVGYSAKSEGQGLSWEFGCDNIKFEEINRSFTCKFDGKSASRGDRNIKWEYSSGRDDISYVVTDNDGLVFKFKSAPRPSGKAGQEYVTSFQVVGMSDEWVREIRNNEDPTGIAYRGYGSSYPKDKYTETYIGLFSKNKFGGGARSSEGSAKNNLFKYSLEVNRPNPDVFLAEWNKENIKKFLDETNARSDAVTKGLVEYVRKRGNNDAERLQQVADGFKDALPDPAPFIGKVLAVVNELKQEGGGAGQGLVAFASRSKRAAPSDKKIQAALSALTESYAKTLEAIANARRGAINKAKALLDQIAQWPSTSKTLEAMKDPVKKNVKGSLETAHGFNLKAQSYEKGFKETVLRKVRSILLDKFEDNYDDNLKSWKQAFPYPNVEQYLDSLPEYIEKAALKPNETTPEERSEISEKLSRAVLEVAEKAFNADFQKGTIVSNIPIAKILGLGSGDDEDEDEDVQFYPSFGIANALLGLISPRRVLPPVDAVGLVIEGSHFQTFDGLLKPFGTACQYLLTSDFASNSFSVAVDVQKKGQNATQSIIVTDGKDTIVISGSPTIYVNGKTSEPTKIGAFKIFQTNRWTVVKGSMGVRVSCLRSEDRQLCEVQASGYFHGKLRGVLGQFDNEITNDKTFPAGNVAESNENFVKSWQLNKDCKGGKTNLYLTEYPYYASIAANENLNTVQLSGPYYNSGMFNSFNSFLLIALLFVSFFNYLRN